jgi:hypothetical protein
MAPDVYLMTLSASCVLKCIAFYAEYDILGDTVQGQRKRLAPMTRALS